MLSQVVINQGNFALQNRAENVVQTVVHCFSITSSNKLIINKIIPLSQSPLGSHSTREDIADAISSFLYIYVPMRTSPVYVPSLNSAFFSEHLSYLYIIRFLFTYLTY